MTIAEVLAEKLSGKRTASGFVCCCPAHEDTDPSLSIMEADDGGLIVHCFAGCAALDVYAALRRMNVLSDTSTPVERPAPAKRTVAHKRQRQELAAWLWTKRRPVTGSPVEKYLIKRGYAGQVPATSATDLLINARDQITTNVTVPARAINAQKGNPTRKPNHAVRPDT